MIYCTQCGIEGRPVKAVGKDADGDPACVGHCDTERTKSDYVVFDKSKAEPEKAAPVSDDDDNRIITAQEIKRGLQMRKDGKTYADIAREFGYTYGHVRFHLMRAAEGIQLEDGAEAPKKARPEPPPPQVTEPDHSDDKAQEWWEQVLIEKRLELVDELCAVLKKLMACDEALSAMGLLESVKK